MIFIALFLIELFVLFLSSIFLTRGISKLVHYISKSKMATVYFLSFLFLPGVIIHELSHFLTAVILFVPVGEISLLPKVHENSVRLGSVEIAKTDFIRRAVIGFAPLLAGCSILFGMFFYFMPGILNFPKTPVWQILIILYFIFQIANTMFSSKKDLEGAAELVLVIISIAIVFYLFHIQIPVFITDKLSDQNLINFFKTLDLFLLAPFILNIFLISFMKLIFRRN